MWDCPWGTVAREPGEKNTSDSSHTVWTPGTPFYLRPLGARPTATPLAAGKLCAWGWTEAGPRERIGGKWVRFFHIPWLKGVAVSLFSVLQRERGAVSGVFAAVVHGAVRAPPTLRSNRKMKRENTNSKFTAISVSHVDFPPLPSFIYFL